MKQLTSRPEAYMPVPPGLSWLTSFAMREVAKPADLVLFGGATLLLAAGVSRSETLRGEVLGLVASVFVPSVTMYLRSLSRLNEGAGIVRVMRDYRGRSATPRDHWPLLEDYQRPTDAELLPRHRRSRQPAVNTNTAPLLRESLCVPEVALDGIRRWLMGALAASPEPQADSECASPEESLLRAVTIYDRQARPAHSPDGVDSVESLCMAGIGATWLLRRKACEICFRWSAPGLRRCVFHSQSKHNRSKAGDDRSLGFDFHGAAAARRVMTWSDHERAMRPAAATWQGATSLPQQAAGILWPREGLDVDRWRRQIREALDLAPLVRCRLSDDFFDLAFEDQLNALRVAVDPQEWDVRAWPRKIQFAQSWLAEETRLGAMRVASRTRQARKPSEKD